jgi:integrase
MAIKRPNRGPRLPKLRRHSTRNLGYVELAGKRLYLGPWGAPETTNRYYELMATWMPTERRRPVAPPPAERAAAELTVVELAVRFMEHAAGYYGPSSSLHTYKAAIRHWRAVAGAERVADFGPKRLRDVRDAMVAAGLARPTCNRLVGLVRAIVRWGVSEELVNPSVLEALRAVAPLQRGRTEAREPEPIGPVPQAHVDAVLPRVASPVAAMIRLQLLTGARPGELVNLRAVDLDTSGSVWTAALREHKNAHRGKARVLYFGPRAQDVLRPYLAGRAVDAPLFSPREAVAELKARGAHCRRRADQQQAEPQTGRRVGDAYDTCSYRRAIERACDAAGVPRWAPNRLRHTVATEIRREYGLEAAALVLGHASPAITDAVYAERDSAKVRQVIARVG